MNAFILVISSFTVMRTCLSPPFMRRTHCFTKLKLCAIMTVKHLEKGKLKGQIHKIHFELKEVKSQEKSHNRLSERMGTAFLKRMRLLVKWCVFRVRHARARKHNECQPAFHIAAKSQQQTSKR
ncbi:hypothetical protein ACQ4LE_004745, partial [Meloidogyne hapla]